MTEHLDFTPDEIELLVSRSGYPFELSVGRALIARGYQVNPSFRYFDRDRSRDYEIDIVANKAKDVRLSNGSVVRCLLRLVIECKSSRLPYVLFGLPAPELASPGTLDPDQFYLHINSSKDAGHPNRYASVLFLRRRDVVRNSHHYFNSGPARYHHSAVVEVKGEGVEARKKAKLNVSDNVSEAIRKLAGFADNQHDNWQQILGDAAFAHRLQGKPQISVYFFLLVHPGNHYRWTDASTGLEQAAHTPVFYSFSLRVGPVSLVVDVAGLDNISTALSCIEASYESVLSNCLPFLLNDNGMPNH